MTEKKDNKNEQNRIDQEQNQSLRDAGLQFLTMAKLHRR
jgi:hypothetical protein